MTKEPRKGWALRSLEEQRQLETRLRSSLTAAMRLALSCDMPLKDAVRILQEQEKTFSTALEMQRLGFEITLGGILL